MLKITELNYFRNDQPILQNLSLQLSSGQILIIRGANGSGKTTLLRLIAGLITPESGRIENQFQSIAYLGHQSGIKLELSPRENAEYLCKLAGADPCKISEILKQVSLFELQFTRCQELSAGLRQRAALACLLCQNASLWLLDEPGTHLDSAGRTVLHQAIEHHCANGGSVAMTLHGDWPGMQADQLDLLLEEAA
jgi:heme exporter protein A